MDDIFGRKGPKNTALTGTSNRYKRNSKHSSLISLPVIQKSKTQPRRKAHTSPGYLRPRAEARSIYEAEASDLISRTQSVLKAARRMEMLAWHPEDDPKYRAQERREDNLARARDNAEDAAFKVAATASERAIRADRAARAQRVKKQVECDDNMMRVELHRAKVALQHKLSNDPVLTRGRGSRRAGPRNDNKAGASDVHGGAVRAAATGLVSGIGHSKQGDEALRRARRVMAEALSGLD